MKFLLAIIATVFFLSAQAQTQSDTIRVDVKEFMINSKKGSGGTISGKQLADMVKFGFYKSNFIEPVSMAVAADYTVNGTTEFYGDEFYINTSITGPDQATFPGPLASGKTSDLLSMVDRLNGEIVNSILANWQKSVRGNVIAVTLEKKSSVPIETRKDAVYAILKDPSTYPEWTLWTWDQYRAYADSSKAIDQRIGAMIELKITEDKRKNIIISPVLSDIRNTRSVALPPLISTDNHLAIFDEERSALQARFAEDVNQVIQRVASKGAIDSESIAAFLDTVFSGNVPSLNIVRAAQQFRKGDLFSYLAIARERFKQNRYFDAYALADMVYGEHPDKKSPEVLEALMIKGEIAYQLTKYYHAYKNFYEVYKIDPSYYNDNFGFIETYLGKTIYVFDARDSLEHSVQVLSAVKTRIGGGKDQRADGIYYYARALKKSGKYEQAIPLYREVLALDPPFARVASDELFECYYKWGWTKFSEDDYARAKEIFEQARMIRTDDFGTNKHFIQSLYALKEFGKADSLLTEYKLLELSYYEWAVILRGLFNKSAERNNAQDALLYADKTLSLVDKHLASHPRHRSSLWLKGSTLVNIGDYDKGIPLLKLVHSADSLNIGFRLDLAEAQLMGGKPEETDRLLNNWFVSHIDSYRNAKTGNELVASFLSYVTQIVLFDKGMVTNNQLAKSENVFDKSTHRIIKSLNWTLFAFDRWLQSYDGASKNLIVSARERFVTAANARVIDGKSSPRQE